VTKEVSSVVTTTGGQIVATLTSGICGTTTPTVTWDANVGETAVTWAITTSMADADCKAVKDALLKNSST
jgi:L-serine deaminase